MLQCVKKKNCDYSGEISGDINDVKKEFTVLCIHLINALGIDECIRLLAEAKIRSEREPH